MKHLPSLTAVFVHYYKHDQLIENVSKLVNALFAFECQIIVVDNSKPADFEQFRELLDQINLSGRHSLTVINSEKNCRFRAYNKGLLAALNDYIVFRSDDDDFDEMIIRRELLSIASAPLQKRPDLLVFEYLYDSRSFAHRRPERPIETLMISRDAFLTSGFVPERDSGDWTYLTRVFDLFEGQFRRQVLMNKAPHGRSVNAVDDLSNDVSAMTLDPPSMSEGDYATDLSGREYILEDNYAGSRFLPCA